MFLNDGLPLRNNLREVKAMGNGVGFFRFLFYVKGGSLVEFGG